jgi:LemA protein
MRPTQNQNADQDDAQSMPLWSNFHVLFLPTFCVQVPHHAINLEEKQMILAIILGLAVLAAIFVMGIYNGLVTTRNGAENAFSQIDVQLTRRHDLIPNLVETAKGYMQHEKGTLEAVIQARNAASAGLKAVAANPSDAAAMQTLGNAEGQLTASLGRLFALSEAYPDLKANQNMMQLSEELTSTENKVSFARQAYNDAAMQLKNKLEMFPSNIIAGMFSFKGLPFLQIDDVAKREAPKVQF